MNKLKVSTRLTMLIGILSLLMASIGALGLYGISQSNTALKTVYEDRTVPLQQLGQITALQLDSRLSLNIAMDAESSRAAAERLTRVESNMVATNKNGRTTWPPR